MAKARRQIIIRIEAPEKIVLAEIERTDTSIVC
jgi:hypothetical protein